MYGGKMSHGFMPSIDIHIHRKEIVEYPITGYVVMEVLSLLIAMVYQHWGGGMKLCPSLRVNTGDVRQNGARSPVWVIHTCQP